MKNFFNKLPFFNRKNDELSTVRRWFGFSGGAQVNEDTAMEVSAFYRGVIYISSQIAKLPWEVKDLKNKIDNSSPIMYLLNTSPNPESTAFHFKLFLVQCAILRGNGYAEIERGIDGRVKYLWPLNPNKVSILRTTDGELIYQIAGGGKDGETIYLRPKDIFHVRNLHTKDAIQGQSVIAYAMTTIGVSMGADRFANALFTNGGMPSGILKTTGTLSDGAYGRLKESWKEQHGGRKTGGTAILEEGVDYSPISHSPDVLQFLESRKFGVTEIARFLGLPPTKLFDTDSAKFNNIEHANLEVATDTLDSWARNLESEADMKLLAGSKGGRYTELDLYAVFRGDMKTRGTYFKDMMSVGAITPNEIREKEGMAPYDGGDKYYIATNNFTPVDRMDEVIDSQIKSKEPQAPAKDTSLNAFLEEYLKMKAAVSTKP
jgi:HK97 family phage portal protein